MFQLWGEKGKTRKSLRVEIREPLGLPKDVWGIRLVGRSPITKWKLCAEAYSQIFQTRNRNRIVYGETGPEMTLWLTHGIQFEWPLRRRGPSSSDQRDTLYARSDTTVLFSQSVTQWGILAAVPVSKYQNPFRDSFTHGFERQVRELLFCRQKVKGGDGWRLKLSCYCTFFGEGVKNVLFQEVSWGNSNKP